MLCGLVLAAKFWVNSLCCYCPVTRLFLIGACFFGFGMGGVVPMQGAVVGAAFGRASFGRVLGAMRPPMAVIHLAGVPFAGWIYDTTGDYTVAFTTFIVLYLFAAAAVMGISVNTKANRVLN